MSQDAILHGLSANDLPIGAGPGKVPAADGPGAIRWQTRTIDYTLLVAQGHVTGAAVALPIGIPLPAKGQVLVAFFELDTAFGGGGTGTCTVQIGVTGTKGKYMAAQSIFTGVAPGTIRHDVPVVTPGADDQQVTATFTVDPFLDALTAGHGIVKYAYVTAP